MTVLSTARRKRHEEFLFCIVDPVAVSARRASRLADNATTSDDDDEDSGEPTITQIAVNAGLNALTMLQYGNGANPAVAMACMPMVAPFNTPPVPYTSWRDNKRAVAFQRALAYSCVAQGGLALLKFFSGNLVGGFFDASIAGVGINACGHEGVSMLPTYMMFAGFNGFIDLLQLLQMYHGVLPIYLLPFQMPAVRPMLLLAGCYFTYEFHKELLAVWRGYQASGPQDTVFVKVMSHEWWGPSPGCAEAEEHLEAENGRPRTLSSGQQANNTTMGSAMGGAGLFGGLGAGTGSSGQEGGSRSAPAPAHFAPFGGTGHRLVDSTSNSGSE